MVLCHDLRHADADDDAVATDDFESFELCLGQRIDGVIESDAMTRSTAAARRY